MSYSIIQLICAAIYVMLLIVILLNRQWRRPHQLLVIHIIAATSWAISDALLRSDYFIDYKVQLFQIAIITGIWWMVQFYYFLRSFVGSKINHIVWFGYAAILVLAIAVFFDPWPKAIDFHDGHTAPDRGWWFWLYLSNMIVMTSAGLHLVITRFKNATEPSERNKIAYLIIAIGMLAGFGFIGVTPIAHDFPISTIGVLLAAGIITYALAKHELISINYILRRGIAWAGIIGIGVTICGTLYALLHKIINIRVEPDNLFLAVLAGIVIATCIFFLKNVFVTRVDQFFFKERYNYHQELSSFIRLGINRVYSLDELSHNLLPPLVKTLNCHQAILMLAKKDSGDFVTEFAEPALESGKPVLSFQKDSPIVRWLLRERRYLTKEQLDTISEFRSLSATERDGIRISSVNILFPLISRDRLVGILVLGRRQSGKYSFEDTNLVESIAGQVAVNLDKEYYQEELRKRQQELAFINKMAAVMNSSLHIQDVYDVFASELKQVISVDFTAVALVEEDELCFTAVDTQLELSWSTGERVPLQGTALEWILENKKTIIEPDLQKDTRFFTSEAYRRIGIRSIASLPLITKGNIIGSLIIASCKPNAYNTDEISLMERLASQVSTSVANAKLYAEAEQRSRIDDLSGLFNRRHFDECLALEVERHSRYGGSFSLIIVDLDNFKSYNDICGHLNGDELLAEIGHLIRTNLKSTDLAFRYGGDEFAIILPHTNHENAYEAAERVRTRICTEMMTKQVAITASIGLASWPTDALRTDDIINAADSSLYHAKRTGGNRTCVISQLLSPSAKNNDVLSDVEKETLNTIYALAATIEARDPYTYGHSRKVRSYAVALAEALNLPMDRVAIVSHAALLHDIGKIGIIDGVLNKPGKLDSKDWELIKMHPHFSRTIVGHVPSLTPCVPAILHHHERWDGSGYPDGLTGKQIPYEARILSIADAFDAMTSLRPYRAPMSYDEAIAELKRASGTQFDPKLVEVFIPIPLTLDPEKFKTKQGTSLTIHK